MTSQGGKKIGKEYEGASREKKEQEKRREAGAARWMKLREKNERASDGDVTYGSSCSTAWQRWTQAHCRVVQTSEPLSGQADGHGVKK